MVTLLRLVDLHIFRGSCTHVTGSVKEDTVEHVVLGVPYSQFSSPPGPSNPYSSTDQPSLGKCKSACHLPPKPSMAPHHESFLLLWPCLAGLPIHLPGFSSLVLFSSHDSVYTGLCLVPGKLLVGCFALLWLLFLAPVP